jgi:hypothetical protein
MRILKRRRNRVPFSQSNRNHARLNSRRKRLLHPNHAEENTPSSINANSMLRRPARKMFLVREHLPHPPRSMQS